MNCRRVVSLFTMRALMWALALLFTAAPVLAAETPDLLGPKIEVLSPADGSALTDNRPVIAASISDSGSGVNPETIRLVLDGMDVTRGCVLQSAASDTWTMTYTPASPLGGGEHRVALQAADRAGNISRHQWSFSVATETEGTRWGLSGTSSLELNVVPLPRLGEHLDLHLEARFSEHATLDATAGLEWLSPFLIPGEPFGLGTLRVANYAAVLEVGPLRTAAGAVEVELPSNVLFPLIGTNAIDVRMIPAAPDSSAQVSGFAGRMLTSSGFSLSLLNFAGGSLEWSSRDGKDAYAMAVRTEADARSGILALFGVGMPLAGTQTFLECLVTLSPDDVAGYGVATGLTYRGKHLGLTASFLGRDLTFETPFLAANLVDRSQAEFRSAGYLTLGRSVLTFSLVGAYGQRTDTETVTVNTDAALRFAASDSLTLLARYQGAARYVREESAIWQNSGTHSATGGVLIAPAGSAGGQAQLNLETLLTREGEWAGLKAMGAMSRPMGPGNLCLSRELAARRNAGTSSFTYRESIVLQSAARPVMLFGVRYLGSLGGDVQVTETAGPGTESATAALSFNSKLDIGLTEALTLTVDGKYTIGTNGPDYRLKLSLCLAF